MKRPASISSLLDGVLSRHGIKRQVTAAMVVVRANEVLTEMLSGPLAKDVCALSFREGRLLLACRHAAASFDAQGITEELGKRLEVAIPDISILGIDIRVKPEPWREW